MSSKSSRIDEEKRTVAAMVQIYCREKHGSQEICTECRTLLDYALVRLDRCPQVAGKPTCSKCTIHCYRPEMREGIRKVMRHSGPRMIIHHPVMAIRHLFREFKK